VADTTGIEWATATWSPWWGCAKVSPACTHCYAEAIADRFRRGEKLWRGTRTRTKDWTTPARVDRKAGREGRRARLFVASMADVFEDHPDVTEWRARALDMLAGLRHTDVLLLTKRPENVLRMVPRWWHDPAALVPCDFDVPYNRGWPRHVWLGTTVEDQQRADERIPHLLRVPAAVRFLSVEPMLGPVDLKSIALPPCSSTCKPGPLDAFSGIDWCSCGYGMGGRVGGVSWVIAGGESGAGARPTDAAWVRALRDQCVEAGVPFFLKQLRSGTGRMESLPALDGRRWAEFPELVRG